MENPEATEGQIHQALVDIGKKEFPYRRAYEDMIGIASEAKLTQMVLEHVEPNVKERLEKILSDGVALEELVKSELFETQFSGDERYQVQDGIMDATDHIKEDLPKEIEKRQAEYDALVEQWRTKLRELQAKIEELKTLATQDTKWKDEIIDKASTFEEGFSVVERDPDIVEITKEIEYWRGTLGEE